MIQNFFTPLQAVLLAFAFGAPATAETGASVNIPQDPGAEVGFETEPLPEISIPQGDLGKTLYPAAEADRSLPPVHLGVFGDWSLFRGGVPAECWATTKPSGTRATKNGAPVEVRRGDVGVFMTLRGGDTPEFSWSSGYPIDKSNTAVIDLDGMTYDLVSDSQTAWLEDLASGEDLLGQLQVSSKMTISGTSQRGTNTVDEYSLAGFADALAEARVACAVAGDAE